MPNIKRRLQTNVIPKWFSFTLQRYVIPNKISESSSQNCLLVIGSRIKCCLNPFDIQCRYRLQWRKCRKPRASLPKWRSSNWRRGTMRSHVSSNTYRKWRAKTRRPLPDWPIRTKCWKTRSDVWRRIRWVSTALCTDRTLVVSLTTALGKHMSERVIYFREYLGVNTLDNNWHSVLFLQDPWIVRCIATLYNGKLFTASFLFFCLQTF